MKTIQFLVGGELVLRNSESIKIRFLVFVFAQFWGCRKKISDLPDSFFDFNLRP